MRDMRRDFDLQYYLGSGVRLNCDRGDIIIGFRFLELIECYRNIPKRKTLQPITKQALLSGGSVLVNPSIQKVLTKRKIL